MQISGIGKYPYLSVEHATVDCGNPIVGEKVRAGGRGRRAGRWADYVCSAVGLGNASAWRHSTAVEARATPVDTGYRICSRRYGLPPSAIPKCRQPGRHTQQHACPACPDNRQRLRVMAVPPMGAKPACSGLGMQAAANGSATTHTHACLPCALLQVERTVRFGNHSAVTANFSVVHDDGADDGVFTVTPSK